jgi:trimethylamine--corrinoid protein Co-methyltransferase
MTETANSQAGGADSGKPGRGRRTGKRRRRHDPEAVKIDAPVVVRPGQLGGAYQPLTTHEIERIHATALDVLENLGMGDPIPILKEHALQKGCWLDDSGRLRFPRALVEDVIADMNRDFTLFGRDPKHDLDLSGKRVNFYRGGGAVKVLDVASRRFRPSRLTDTFDMSRLIDQLEHIHGFSRLVVATEIANLRAADISTAYASVAGTTKHTALVFNEAESVMPTIEMMDLIAGGEGEFSKRPFCHGGGCPVISPLRYGVDNSEVCVEVTKMGAPVWVIVAPQAGATSPAALAGSLVQATAETLAGLLLVDLVVPRHPVIMGPWAFVSDLRTGAFTGGSGEEAVLSAAAVQIMNFYDLPSSVGAGMTDSKFPDNQAGYEKGITVLLAALAGANNVGEAAGMLASLLGCSYEAILIDNDMHGCIQRVLRGIEVTDETLSYDVIRETVQGPGHYLGQPQTLALMRSEYLYPELASRETVEDWEEQGSPDITQVAHGRVREMLSSHYPRTIEPAVDQRIRERFPIMLDPEEMEPGNGRWD